MIKNLKIALVHDDLVQWGGAERMLLALAQLFPEAPIFTAVNNRDNLILNQGLLGHKVITSFLQNIPGWKSIYRQLLPLYPVAFEQFDFSGFNLVISQTTRFAKSIITKPGTKHLCYCHTPPRFLWNFSSQIPNKILQPYFSLLRTYDFISSRRVDYWIAGSKNAQKRIEKVYHQKSTVIYPFIDRDRFKYIQPFDGGYLLVISRLNKYKRVDLAIQAATRLNRPLKVVGTGPEEGFLKSISGPLVDFTGVVDENSLALLLAGSQALIIAAEEDFGLTSLEAQALGKPVIAYRKGGAVETIIENKTGYFFNDQTTESLIEALQQLDKKGYNIKSCQEQAARFDPTNFQRDIKKIVFSL